ncbi:MAG: hypothetical protein U1E25_14715 [Methylocystis sp.]
MTESLEKAKSDQNEKSAFCSATAEATGKSRRSVEIAAARGAALGDDLNDIAGTSLDKAVELDALAKAGAIDKDGSFASISWCRLVVVRHERQKVVADARQHALAFLRQDRGDSLFAAGSASCIEPSRKHLQRGDALIDRRRDLLDGRRDIAATD